jgi:hypothetical protein
MDGWMDGWLGRWMDRWIDGWMDGWVDGCKHGWVTGSGSRVEINYLVCASRIQGLGLILLRV